MQRRMREPLSAARQVAAQPDNATRQTPQGARHNALPGCMQSGVPLHEAQALTGGGNVAHITLDDQLYVLRITRAGKLILTK